MEMVHLWLVLTFQTYTYGFLLVHRFNSVFFVIRTESIETEEEWAHQLQEVYKKVKCQEPSSIRFPVCSIQVNSSRVVKAQVKGFLSENKRLALCLSCAS